VLIRIRRAAVWALVLACAVAGRAPEARAAAEVHKFNLLIAGNPSSLAATKYNDLIQSYNQLVLDPRGYVELKSMHFGWFYQIDGRYFVRPNITVDAGFGSLEASQFKEFLPRIGQSIDIDTKISSDVWNVGTSYYLQPYNQGDFQARMYFSAGLLSLSNVQFKFGKVELGTDSTSSLGDAHGVSGGRALYDFHELGSADGPGWYVETGAHMFFSSRYSVMLGFMYRDMKVRTVDTALTSFDANGNAFSSPSPVGSIEVDLSGVSARMGVCVGF
jgi:hypothetical protein